MWVWKQWPDERLHVSFCDVGQGDASVIVLGPFQALVDTGADKKKVLECLASQMPFWDRRIEVVFISHADNDHTGALGEIKKRYQVDRVVDNPKINDIVRYGDLSFDIIKGSEPVDTITKPTSETNAKSVVMRMVYGEMSVLFTGDTDLGTELALLASGVLKKAEVLKVSHHGSKYGSGKEFLELVRPKFAVVSVSVKNSYGHPASDTLIRLDTVGAKVLRTDKVGMVSFSSDGKDLQVFTEK
jgi:competence protein ComEC